VDVWILKEFRGLAEAVVVVEVDGVGVRGRCWDRRRRGSHRRRNRL